MRQIKIVRILAVIFCVFILSATCFAQVQLLKAVIVGNINNGRYWSNSSLIVEKGDILKLSAVVTARVENMYSQVYLSEINQLVMDQDTIASGKVILFKKVLAKPPELYWYRIEPVNVDTFYLNHPGNVTPFVVIPYHEVPIPGWTNQWIVDLRSLPDIDQLFPGTIWLKVEVVLDRQFAASPGYENRMKVYDTIDFGGLNQKVFRIGIKGRTGCTFIDNILLYRNLPVIINPSSWSGSWDDHQTSHWIGGNLISFMISAAEMSDIKLWNYLDKLPLPELNFYDVTEYYRKNVYLNDDIFTTEEGETIVLNKIIYDKGDILLNNDRVGILYEDRSPINSEQGGGPNKLLDRYDLILECNYHSLQIMTIDQSLGGSIQLIRWKNRWKTY
ncbi:MAG: hypothetical protein ISS29_05470 [Candidatus Marinimicrobia bacterium]|nr:hypothetical protein [Candidatus Neomarinimicrobiota bacterium]